MPIYYTKTSRWRCFWEYLFSALLVLELNSVYIQSYNFNFRISELLILVSFILGLSAIGKFTKNAKVRLVVIMYEMTAFILMLASVRGDSVLTYFLKFMVFVPSLFIYYADNASRIQTILGNIHKIVVFLAMMSLVLYIGGVVLKIIPPSGHFLIDWGGAQNRIAYYGLLFVGQGQDVGTINLLRNTGIFTEAPMYGCVLVMALATNMFLLPQKRKNKARWILCLTIITTISVAAIMTMTVMLYYKYYSRFSKITRMIFIILTIPILIYVIWSLYTFKQTTGASYSIRLDDYYAGYQAWKKNLLFGIGYGNMDEITKHMMTYRQNRDITGYSNALMYILATIGLWGLAMYLLPFYQAIKKSIKHKRKELSMIFICLICLLIVTLFPMHLFLLNYISIALAFFIYKEKDVKSI